MTPHQMIDRALRVEIGFSCAEGAQVDVNITKREAHRLIREYGLPDKAVGTVLLHGDRAYIAWAT